MTVFVKRYPEKGELPKCKEQSYRVYVTSNKGIVYYDKYDGWEYNIEWWLEEIELPSQKKLEMSHGIEYKPHLNGYTNGYILGYKKAVRSIINLLK